MTYHASAVVPEDVLHVWNDAWGWLAPAVAQSSGRISVDDLRRGLYRGEYQLWVAFKDDAIDGAIITTITEYPNKRILTWLFIGGDHIEDWCDSMHKLVERFSRDMGCEGAEIVGRKGWVRFMKKYGWNEEYITVDKMFDNEEEQRLVA